jgi:hypothetical protein
MENIEPKRIYKRDQNIQNYAAISLTIVIVAVGWAMMTFTSSPQMKGAAFLWIPAALQLIAGVWFGPVKGLLIGGIGAYGAGILAYGGWGLADIIMNPIAGGIANSLIPGLLFRVFKIRPDFHATPQDIKKALIVFIIMLIIVIGIGLSPIFINYNGQFAYLIAGLLLLFGYPIIFAGIKINKKDFFLAVIICVLISAFSALIGSFGVVISGNTWEGAILGTGIGWWLGDTVSCFLGLYMLAYLTPKALEKGIFKDYTV